MRIRRDERGSALIIALAFLLLFSLWLSATLSTTESGLQIGRSMRVQPKQLYAADAAIEQTIQKLRYDPTEGVFDDNDCSSESTYQDTQQKVFVQCEPDANSGRGEEGESSPPVGIIALSNGGPLQNEYAYQQFGNSILRIDGGVFSNTPLLFVNGNNCNANGGNCQQLNLCPRNKKTIDDAVLVKNAATLTSFSNPFTSSDVGVPITGNGVAVGATISAVVTPGVITMSKNATSSGSNKSVTFREDYPPLQSQCHVPTAAEDPTGDKRRTGKVTGRPRVSIVGQPTPTPAPPESCDETRIVRFQFNCDSSYVTDPIGTDPGYPVDKFSGFSHQDPPACTSGTRAVVSLEPGRYDDAAALSALTTGCDKLIWFKPGSYYFDFPDANAVWNIGGSNLGNLTVVGGAKTWTGEPFNGCVSYNNNSNTSTVTVVDGTTPFKGLTPSLTWINAGYNLPYKTVLKSVAVNGSSATFTGAPLTNNWCGTADKPAWYTVSPVVGAKNSLGSLCDPDTSNDHDGVEFIFGGQSRMLITDGKTEICSPVSGTKQQVAMYGVKNAQGQLKAQTGCIVAQPYEVNGNGTCPMVKAPQGSKPALMVHGTIYAPLAAIDLSLQGVGYQVVSRGIIARVVAMSISPSSQFTQPVIFSPNFGSIPGAPRRLVLTACLDRACDDGGRAKIRALVRIQDSDDNNNAGVPGYKVFIDSWSVL